MSKPTTPSTLPNNASTLTTTLRPVTREDTPHTSNLSSTKYTPQYTQTAISKLPFPQTSRFKQTNTSSTTKYIYPSGFMHKLNSDEEDCRRRLNRIMSDFDNDDRNDDDVKGFMNVFKGIGYGSIDCLHLDGKTNRNMHSSNNYNSNKDNEDADDGSDGNENDQQFRSAASTNLSVTSQSTTPTLTPSLSNTLSRTSKTLKVTSIEKDEYNQVHDKMTDDYDVHMRSVLQKYNEHVKYQEEIKKKGFEGGNMKAVKVKVFHGNFNRDSNCGVRSEIEDSVRSENMIKYLYRKRQNDLSTSMRREKSLPELASTSTFKESGVKSNYLHRLLDDITTSPTLEEATNGYSVTFTDIASYKTLPLHLQSPITINMKENTSYTELQGLLINELLLNDNNDVALFYVAPNGLNIVGLNNRQNWNKCLFDNFNSEVITILYERNVNESSAGSYDMMRSKTTANLNGSIQLPAVMTSPIPSTVMTSTAEVKYFKRTKSLYDEAHVPMPARLITTLSGGRGRDADEDIMKAKQKQKVYADGLIAKFNNTGKSRRWKGSGVV